MAKFQRRHYTSVAKLVSDMRLTALDTGDLFALETVDVFIDRCSQMFYRDNPRFLPTRFLTACGIPETDGKPLTHNGKR